MSRLSITVKSLQPKITQYSNFSHKITKTREALLSIILITLNVYYIINGYKQKVLFDFVQISRLKDCFVGHCEQTE